jgi:hypothetical protein
MDMILNARPLARGKKPGTCPTHRTYPPSGLLISRQVHPLQMGTCAFPSSSVPGTSFQHEDLLMALDVEALVACLHRVPSESTSPACPPRADSEASTLYCTGTRPATARAELDGAAG